MTQAKTAAEAPAVARLPATSMASDGAAIDDLAPRQIVAELDKFVVSQKRAKRAVAIALRNRWRRQQISEARWRKRSCPRTS